VSRSLDRHPKEPNTTVGYCVICGHEASFWFSEVITPQLKNAWSITDEIADAFNRRESEICSFCGGSLRVRRLCAALMQTFSERSGRVYNSFSDLLEDDEFRHLRIGEINACGALHNYLKQHPNLSYSEYVPGVARGAEYNGIRCEDLQGLTYPNDFFDIVLTSDTLEHVPDPEQAFNEIYRVLKPTGIHLFTVPVIPSQGATIRRARFVNGERRFLLSPAYHGCWGRDDMLVFTDFGMDILEKLKLVGFATDILFNEQDGKLDLGFVFRSKKARLSSPARTGEYPMLDWTGERFLPWIEGAQIHYEHLHRYAFAAHFVKGKKVLDLACGEGYGTYMLAREAEYVAGVEIDKQTVRHARSRYIKDNLEFIEGSILDVPIQGEGKFDVVVCFEAIEHIAEHDKLLSEVKRLLTDDGLFIASTPNKAVYTDAPNFHNPFHIEELQFDEFQGLLKRYFKHVHIYGQRVYAGSNMWSIDQQKSSGYIEEIVKKGDREFYFAERISKEPVYFIALASNASSEPLMSVTDSWLTDASNVFFDDYVRRLQDKEARINELEARIQQIQRSIPMQLAKRFQGALNRLAPTGTRRRRLCELILTGTRVILNEGWKTFFRAVHEYLRRGGRVCTKAEDG
jgi:2-polyprenyl-3-methyl-5-hydroxy-6-metoxy-1,4-benzoquinol methylase